MATWFENFGAAPTGIVNDVGVPGGWAQNRGPGVGFDNGVSGVYEEAGLSGGKYWRSRYSNNNQCGLVWETPGMFQDFEIAAKMRMSEIVGNPFSGQHGIGGRFSNNADLTGVPLTAGEVGPAIWCRWSGSFSAFLWAAHWRIGLNGVDVNYNMGTEAVDNTLARTPGQWWGWRLRAIDQTLWAKLWPWDDEEADGGEPADWMVNCSTTVVPRIGLVGWSHYTFSGADYDVDFFGVSDSPPDQAAPTQPPAEPEPEPGPTPEPSGPRFLALPWLEEIEFARLPRIESIRDMQIAANYVEEKLNQLITRANTIKEWVDELREEQESS